MQMLSRLCLAMLWGAAASTPDIRSKAGSPSLLERMEMMQERLQSLEAEKQRTEEAMARSSDRMAALEDRVLELEGAQARMETRSTDQISETPDREPAWRRAQADLQPDDAVIGAKPARIITREVVSSRNPTGAAMPDPCEKALSSACGKAQKASKGNCLICAGSHATGCASGTVDTFCNGKVDRRRLQLADHGSSVAEQINVHCTDDSLSTKDCIPECGASVHGFLLLLNIEGNDSKLSCELHRGLYSWVGAAVRS